MKIIKAVSLLSFLFLSIFFMKSYQASYILYPETCICSMDDKLSLDFKKELYSKIEHEYAQSKNPNAVILFIQKNFVEVVEVKAQRSKPDKMLFEIKSSNPIFKLNGRAVCDNKNICSLDHYDDDVTKNLYEIKANQDLCIQEIVSFFKDMPKPLFDVFNVNVVHKQEIVLQEKNKPYDSMIFSCDIVPTIQDFALFRDIQGQLSRDKNKQSKIFDFRFHNQIVIK